MHSLIRALFRTERHRQARYPDYAPRHWGAAEVEEVPVPGPSLARASRNYFDATMDYMGSADLYRSIRLDRTHRVRLISRDFSATRNRAAGHRAEGVYRVALRLRVGDGPNGEPVYDSVKMVPVLASDYDRFMLDHLGVTL